LIGYCAVVAIAVMFFAVSSPISAQEKSGWTILEYDDEGRVIGSRSGAADRTTGSPAPDDDTDAGGGSASELTPTHQKQVETGELLIASPPKHALNSLNRLGFTVLEQSALDALDITMWRVRIPDDLSLPEALQRLRKALPDAIIDTNDLLDLSRGKSPVQVAQTRQDFARAAVGWGVVPETCGKGVILGQIDGAVDVRHTALTDRDVIYKSLIKQNRQEAAEDHGTAIAVMLVGKPRAGRLGGLLPGARLYAANIFERWQGRDKGNLAAMIRAVDWLVFNDVQVANFSVAGGDNQLMRLVIGRATQKGLIIVAAAGNNGPGAVAAWPAADPQSLAVTAIDRSYDLYRYANRGTYIDFAAPGVDIMTETPTGIREQSGTSMAAPFVTAMVALHLQAGFPADPERIRNSLKRYTHDLGAEGRDSDFGFGLVRLRPQCQ
jgi:subtilisin family serine protease